MRSDLRRLLWRLRTGVVRRAALETGVRGACERLVDRRFSDRVELQEVSRYARPLLATFEAEIARAHLLAPEGAHRSAVEAVERAEAALAAARQMAEAHAAWEAAAEGWVELREQWGLAAFSDLATLREGACGLAVAESFLRDGEPRKARFVVRLCAETLSGLTVRRADPERRGSLVARLLELRQSAHPPEERLVQVLGRLADEGMLELADRLLDDWRMQSEAPEAGAAARRRASAETLGRIVGGGREAHRLAGELAALAPPTTPGEASAADP